MRLVLSSALRGLIASGLVFAAGCIPCRDGLDNAEWEARERVRAAASLPRERLRLANAMDSAWATSRPRDLTDDFRFVPDEQFSVGGLYGFGGPYYAHSCIDPRSDPPSSFLLHHVRVGLTPDSLVLMSGWLSADDSLYKLAGRVGPRVDRQALSLRTVTDAGLRVFRDTLRVFLRCTSSSPMCFTRLAVAPADSSAGEVFVAHLRSSARRLQRATGDPR
jgi:hypothetical protein